ncbi:MAG: GFA family protein [Oceanospirillaceae bacterium]
MVNIEKHLGGCLCEAIRYQVNAPLRPVVACHCRQCQKTSGFHVAATNVAQQDLTFLCADSLKWYQSSSAAKRGFCGICGSNLFWKPLNNDSISIFAGTLDQPTGLSIVEHVYVQDKGDYYLLNDDLPKHDDFDGSLCV